MKNHMNNLPYDIIHLLVTYLEDVVDRMRLFMTCKRFYQLYLKNKEHNDDAIDNYLFQVPRMPSAFKLHGVVAVPYTSGNYEYCVNAVKVS